VIAAPRTVAWFANGDFQATGPFLPACSISECMAIIVGADGFCFS